MRRCEYYWGNGKCQCTPRGDLSCPEHSPKCYWYRYHYLSSNEIDLEAMKGTAIIFVIALGITLLVAIAHQISLRG